MNDAGIVTGVAVAVANGRITSIGPRAELERAHPDAFAVDCRNRVLTPGFVDSHTHAIFGKPRFEEQEQRAAGLDYMEFGVGIARKAWLEPRDVLNAWGVEDVLAFARARRGR